MKAKDISFNEMIKNKITERKTFSSIVREEIETTRNDITNIENQIRSFSDFDDIEKYGSLKRELEFKKNKLELLQKKEKAECTYNSSEMHECYRAFKAERSRIDNEFIEKLKPIVAELQKLVDKTTENLTEYDRTFESWRSAFRVTDQSCSSSPLADPASGLLRPTSQYLTSVKNSGRI